MDILENMKIEKQIIFDRVRYLMLKSDVSDVYFHKYTEIQMNLGDDLPLGKTLNVQNVVILIKSVFLMRIIIVIILKRIQKNVHINNMKMLFYCGIEVSECIDVNKTRIFKDCITIHN